MVGLHRLVVRRHAQRDRVCERVRRDRMLRTELVYVSSLRRPVDQTAIIQLRDQRIVLISSPRQYLPPALRLFHGGPSILVNPFTKEIESSNVMRTPSDGASNPV